MTAIMIPFLVLVATCVQTYTSAKEVGAARRDALDWWDAEDQLVAEHRWWWRRWRVRRELRSWRDADIRLGIRHLQLVLGSWVLLVAASATSLVASIV